MVGCGTSERLKVLIVELIVTKLSSLYSLEVNKLFLKKKQNNFFLTSKLASKDREIQK